MDQRDQYALQRQEMLRREALELRLVPVQASRETQSRKRVALQTIEAALAAANASLEKYR